MGLRGPLPTPEGPPAEPLARLTPPSWLGKEGQAYWKRNAKWCAENQLLTKQTADSFAHVCDLWDRLSELRGTPTGRVFLDCSKAYQQAAKNFRLVPCDKPNQKPAERHEEKKEFVF